jgi:DNA repair photolyase
MVLGAILALTEPVSMRAGRDFETKIVVKVNAPDVLRRELAAKRWKGEHIAMGTATATLGLAA